MNQWAGSRVGRVTIVVVLALVALAGHLWYGLRNRFFDLMIYRKAFESGELGYASALSVILFCIVLAVSAVQLRVFDRLTTDA